MWLPKAALSFGGGAIDEGRKVCMQSSVRRESIVGTSRVEKSPMKARAVL